MSGKEYPGALAGATGAGSAFQAAAGGTQEIAHKAKKGTRYRVTLAGGEHFDIAVSGRTRWALDRLRAAGESGCTPITQPAPRWAAYVHNLRELGVAIETIHEKHGGAFAGTHARYVLRCQAAPDWKGGTQ